MPKYEATVMLKLIHDSYYTLEGELAKRLVHRFERMLARFSEIGLEVAILLPPEFHLVPEPEIETIVPGES